MYYAQQQYALMQQRQAAYYQTAMRQRMQQQQAMLYYQQIGQQYGYAAMQQAMQQNMFYQHQQQQHAAQMQTQYSRHSPSTNSDNQVILSAEEQPLLSGGPSKTSTHKSQAPRKTRKRRRPDQESEDDDDDDDVAYDAKVSIDADIAGLDKDGYDRATFVNSQEVLPNIDYEFDEWLAFSKKLWRRQKKYKGVFAAEDARKSCLDESIDSISPSNDSPLSAPGKSIIYKSAFMSVRARMKSKRSVFKNEKAVNVMIKMGLAPPWRQMAKYKKWSKCLNIGCESE